MPLYNASKAAKLAAELGCSPEEIEKPLSLAALAIGPFISDPEATEPEQLAALRCLAADAESVLNRVKGLDSRSRRRLLNEYGAEGDSEGDALLALEYLATDKAALDRLSQNLTVATRRLSQSQAKSTVGRPKNSFENSFERFAAGKLLEVCKAIHGDAVFRPRSSEKRSARRFLICALMMIDDTKQSAARSATDDALKNSKKIPCSVG
jgi:hypothetical protein